MSIFGAISRAVSSVASKAASSAASSRSSSSSSSSSGSSSSNRSSGNVGTNAGNAVGSAIGSALTMGNPLGSIIGSIIGGAGANTIGNAIGSAISNMPTPTAPQIPVPPQHPDYAAILAQQQAEYEAQMRALQQQMQSDQYAREAQARAEAERQAAAEAEARRNAFRHGIRGVEDDLTSSMAALENDYFLRMLQQQQQLAGSGITGNLAQDQMLRMNMARQASMADELARANAERQRLEQGLQQTDADELAMASRLAREIQQQSLGSDMARQGMTLDIERFLNDSRRQTAMLQHQIGQDMFGRQLSMSDVLGGWNQNWGTTGQSQPLGSQTPQQHEYNPARSQQTSGLGGILNNLFDTGSRIFGSLTNNTARNQTPYRYQ